MGVLAELLPRVLFIRPGSERVSLGGDWFGEEGKVIDIPVLSLGPVPISYSMCCLISLQFVRYTKKGTCRFKIGSNYSSWTGLVI